MSERVTEDQLTLSEYLTMETLISRVRLGEYCWTFPKSRRGMHRVLKNLESYDLIRLDTDTYGNFRAFITEHGIGMFADEKYMPPKERASRRRVEFEMDR